MNILQNIFVREIFGISASVFVLISMTMKSDNRIGNIRMRTLNMIGSILFIVYGLWIGSFCTIFLNVICLATHIYYIIGLCRSKD